MSTLIGVLIMTFTYWVLLQVKNAYESSQKKHKKGKYNNPVSTVEDTRKEFLTCPVYGRTKL